MALNDSPDVVHWCSRPKAASAVVCITLLLLLSATTTPQASAKDTALLLKQWSQLLGPTDLLLSKKGIRLRISNRNMTLLMTPPTWKAQFLNIQSKVYCQVSASEWRSPMTATASFFRPGDPSSLRSVGSEASTLDGLTCRKYTLKAPITSDSKGDHSWQRLLVKDGILYGIEDKSYPQDVTMVLGKTFGTLQVAAIPLAFKCFNNANSPCEEIKLTGHSDVTLNPADLLVPKDFKLLKSAAEVMAAEKGAQGLSEFMK